IYVLYVLDLAEIPTFQARPAVRAEGEAQYAARTAVAIARHLELTADGRRLPLTPLRHVLAFPPGQAGLHTTRLEAVFVSPPLARPASIVYRDTHFPGRIGWKEIAGQQGSSAPVTGASGPAKPISGYLLGDPTDARRHRPR